MDGYLNKSVVLDQVGDGFGKPVVQHTSLSVEPKNSRLVDGQWRHAGDSVESYTVSVRKDSRGDL